MKRILIIAASFLLIVSCKKETISTNTVNANKESDAITADSISKAINPNGIFGLYNVRGSRTVYNGQANPEGSNVRLSLDYFATKKIQAAPDKKHLTCPYGEGKYVNRGWAYLIGYNSKTNQLTLEPNDKMKAGIVTGSFETLYADYNPRFKSFTFQTRFTALEDNGDESEVIEPLSEQ